MVAVSAGSNDIIAKINSIVGMNSILYDLSSSGSCEESTGRKIWSHTVSGITDVQR